MMYVAKYSCRNGGHEALFEPGSNFTELRWLHDRPGGMGDKFIRADACHAGQVLTADDLLFNAKGRIDRRAKEPVCPCEIQEEMARPNRLAYRSEFGHDVLDLARGEADPCGIRWKETDSGAESSSQLDRHAGA